MTLFQSSSLYERVLPKAGPEHTVSTEKREKEKQRQSNKQAQDNSSTPHLLPKDRLHFTGTTKRQTIIRPLRQSTKRGQTRKRGDELQLDFAKI